MNQYEYKGEWPWKWFTPGEISCRCCDELWVGDDDMPEFFRTSMDHINALREMLGRPIYLTSGHRCKKHNVEVGGVKQSYHMQLAFDCWCAVQEMDKFISAAETIGFRGIGRYPKRAFVHLDLRPQKTRWRG